MTSVTESAATTTEEENCQQTTVAEENEDTEEQIISVADTEESEQLVLQQPENQVPEQTEELERQTVQVSDQSDRLVKLPLTRIKNIIKMDPDVSLASQEAVVTIAKAAELFIGAITKDASYKTVQAKRRTVVRKDLEHIMDTRDCYAFLEGAMES